MTNPSPLTSQIKELEDQLAAKIPKVLIANRGEIARRVARTCRRLGIATVAVYSEADANLPFVAECDEAFALGSPEPASSYLDTQKIIAAARETGAKAIHPGYGFLSENASFARELAKNDLIFIGPPPEAMELMGDKIRAREKMEAAGVPVVPGYSGEDSSAEKLKTEAERVGYPVMLKASAGGGGKGMRLVEKPADLADALEAARREAGGAFGDDRVFLEKFVTNPRHVEVQVVADGQGQVFHFYERDCSLQRRHQKVIEEAPAPGLPEEVRRHLTQTAIRAAEAVDYRNAGTIEFIVNGDNPSEFYFLEMNTRLQVEHPVTEMITGLDLVSLMLATAAGLPFPFRQEDIPRRGHAFEARLYAEDPARNFLPATGTVEVLEFPDGGENRFWRFDSGIAGGNEISIWYDPMIAKIIAWSPDGREAALESLAEALDGTVLFGLTTNRDFLRVMARHRDFRDGKITTGFIAEHFPDGYDHREVLRQKLTHDESVKVAIGLAMYRHRNPAPDPAEVAPETSASTLALWQSSPVDQESYGGEKKKSDARKTGGEVK